MEWRDDSASAILKPYLNSFLKYFSSSPRILFDHMNLYTAAAATGELKVDTNKT